MEEAIERKKLADCLELRGAAARGGGCDVLCCVAEAHHARTAWLAAGDEIKTGGNP